MIGTITSHSSPVNLSRSTEPVWAPSWKTICKVTWTIKRKAKAGNSVAWRLMLLKPTTSQAIRVSTRAEVWQRTVPVPWSSSSTLSTWSHRTTSEWCRTPTHWRVLPWRRHWGDMKRVWRRNTHTKGSIWRTITTRLNSMRISSTWRRKPKSASSSSSKRRLRSKWNWM